MGNSVQPRHYSNRHRLKCGLHCAICNCITARQKRYPRIGFLAGELDVSRCFAARGLLGREGGQRQRVQAVGELLRQECVDLSMPIDAASAGEGRSDNQDIVMGLAPLTPATVADVLV